MVRSFEGDKNAPTPPGWCEMDVQPAIAVECAHDTHGLAQPVASNVDGLLEVTSIN